LGWIGTVEDSAPGERPDVPPALPQPQALVPLGYSPEPQPAGWQGEDHAGDARRLLSALLRHKWLVIVLTVAGTVGGFVVSRFVPSQYVAQATLWIEVGTQGTARPTGPIQAEELLQWSSWVDLLRSFVVLDEVVQRQHAYLQPGGPADSAAFAGFGLKPTMAPGAYRLDVSRDARTFVLTSADRQVQRGQVGDSVGPAIGFAWLPPAKELWAGRSLRFRVLTPRDAALRLQHSLQAILPQQGNFLRLELTGVNRTATAATLNDVADRFVEVAAELKRQKLTQLSTILQRQLNSSYADLRSAENALESFRVKTITLPSEQGATPVTPGLEQTRDPVFRAFFEMRVQRDQLNRDRSAIIAALARGDSDMTAMGLQAIPSVRESAELTQALTTLTTKEAEVRALRLQFGPTYPPLRLGESQVQELRRRTVPSIAQKLVSELTTRLADLDSRVGSASHELQEIPRRAVEEARLRRDEAIAENLYTTLQQRYEEARLAEVSSVPDVRILDRAVTPEQPLKNKAAMVFFGGIMGGLGAGVGLALLLGRFDRRVRYPEQVSMGMGLPILGVVPRLSNGGRLGTPEAESQVVEALRTIRLNLEHAYGAAGPLLIAVTSPGSGDGKSFLSSNLAVSFADAGHRTVVIDADIRRGTLHRVFALQRKPGLLDYLGGGATYDAIVQATSVKGVEFIGCGTRKNAGPELLASGAMSQLLVRLRTTYGVIIIDSAPLGAGVDALVLGSLTGNIVLVLRTGVTDRDFALAKLDDVSRLPIRVLGAVINDVKPGDGYHSYSYYGYLPGYETSEEDEMQAKRLPGKV
jgi:capsular exopolysaccharide synthesis family protein